MMLSEKYRPKTFDEGILSHLEPEEVTFLRNALEQPQLPNVLLYGKPGTGKTTLARIICNEEKYDVWEFNGSNLTDRDRIRLAESIGYYPLCGRKRCIWIDEADGLSSSTQRALRVLIEKCDHVGWILAVSDRHSIIDALQSRLISISCSLPPSERLNDHATIVAERCLAILEQGECVMSLSATSGGLPGSATSTFERR